MKQPKLQLLLAAGLGLVFSLNMLMGFSISSTTMEASSPPIVTNNDNNQSLLYQESNNNNNEPTIREVSNRLPTLAPVDLVSSIVDASLSTRRKKNNNTFPLFGTQEFNETCAWTLVKDRPPPKHECTIYVQQQKDSNEGFSSWISMVASGAVVAFQTGCQLYIDFLEEINVSAAFLPRHVEDGHYLNWIPKHRPVSCSNQTTCFTIKGTYATQGTRQLAEYIQAKVGPTPNYRNPYGMMGHQRIQIGQYRSMRETLGPSFDMKTSMGCALQATLRLSPALTMIQPNLYSELLPALFDTHNNDLVMTVYIRTGHAENINHREHTDKYEPIAQRVVDCARIAEQQHFSSSNNGQDGRVTWLVISDSPFVKTWVEKEYTTSTRRILYTDSRGAHTRNKESPSTVDFAAAALDWWLIGEAAHVVVSDYTGPSFSNTAAFRTGRPFYMIQKKVPCSRIETVLTF